MTAIQLDTHPGGRRRAIGPLGTTARVLVGGLLLGSLTWGHLTRGFHPSAWLLGLVGFPALVVVGQWLRARRTPIPLQATGPVARNLVAAVLPAIACVFLLGLIYRGTTAPTVVQSTTGLVELGGDYRSEPGLGLEEPPGTAPGAQEPPVYASNM